MAWSATRGSLTRSGRRPAALLAASALLLTMVSVVARPAYAADDPRRDDQWGLDAVKVDLAQSTAGTGEGVVIAVVDSGVDLDHPDLAANLVAGKDFVDGDSSPDDENGHGTHAAGIAAAVAGNGIGIEGAAPDIKIMPVRVLDADGVGSTDNVARGIDWAVDNGADVINLSLGGGTDLLSRLYKSGPLNDAILRAEDHGVLVVAAAGNDATFIVNYDAETPVLVVNSSNRAGEPSVFTSFGDPRAVAAPGSGILSTAPTEPTTLWPGGSSGYEELSGTSMATPLVAGIAALMVGPGRSPYSIRDALRRTAENPNDEPRLGAGIVNAAAAVLAFAGEPAGVGLHDPNTGIWYLLEADGTRKNFYFGDPGDFAMYGDWDCDGTDTPGLYRQSDGFVYLRNSNTQGVADIRFFFGNPADEPLGGDFNGDGCDTVSIWRPSENRVYVINELGEDEKGLGKADFFYDLGQSGDRAFVGDFDDDGIDTVSVYRPSNGSTSIYNELAGGSADTTFTYGSGGSDLPVAGDWDGNGTDTIGVFQAPSPYVSQDGALLLRNSNSAGNADFTVGFGEPGWRPISGIFQEVEGSATSGKGVGLPDQERPTVRQIRRGDVSGAVELSGALLAQAGGDPDVFLFTDGTGVILLDVGGSGLDPADLETLICYDVGGAATTTRIDATLIAPCA